MTLYDKLKPEIKEILNKEAENYSICIECIFDDLKTKTRYSELTIDDVKLIHTFANLSTYKLIASDILYGEHIFNT